MNTAMLGSKARRGVVELCISSIVVAAVVVCKDSIAGNIAACNKDMSMRFGECVPTLKLLNVPAGACLIGARV